MDNVHSCEAHEIAPARAGDIQDALITKALKKSVVYRKNVVLTAVQVTEPTLVVTYLSSGEYETEKVAKVGDFIVTNPGGEQYVLPEVKFLAWYVNVGKNRWQAKGRILVTRNPWNERIKVDAPWGDGGVMYGDKDCFIATALEPGSTEPTDYRYIIEAGAFYDTYIREDGLSETEAAVAELIFEYGSIDGVHHKEWVLDQTLRLIYKDRYDEKMREYLYGADGPDTYEWGTGIAP